MSTENNSRNNFQNCIIEATGSTGETFSGICGYMRVFKPSMVICENVEGLTKRIKGCEPEVHSVMRMFKSLCYSANWKVVDSKEYVLPQRRHRCWMWAFRNDLAASPLGFGPEADKAMPETLEALRSKAISPSRLFQLMGISKRRFRTGCSRQPKKISVGQREGLIVLLLCHWSSSDHGIPAGLDNAWHSSGNSSWCVGKVR